MSPVNRLTIPVLSRRRFLYLTAGAATATVSAGRAGVVAASAPNAVTAANGAFLDAGVVHEIAVTFDQSAYDAMVETYTDGGEKEWIEATVSIDGSTYAKAGMRLKGNSSLGGRRTVLPPGAEEGTPTTGSEGPDAESNPQGTPAAGPEGTDGEASLDAMDEEGSWDEPERLPWLIRLDKNVDGQQHDGLKEVVIRSNRSQTSLNEAVALDLIAEAGLASQLAAYTGFSVNGSAPALRLTIEHPNDDWMALRFSPDGLLYKGEATGDYSYRGDDPDSYNEIFDLEAGGSGDDAEDMGPLIEFLDFINNSDDETFAKEIEERVDVPQFAVYSAMMKLIDNFDDINGPGNNGYLYFDREAGQFTVVPWDMNLAFGGIGGGPGSESEFVIDGEPAEMPEGFDPASGAAPPDLGTPVSGTGPSGNGPVVRTCGPDDECVNGPGIRTNPLVERITTMAEYTALVDQASSRLRADLYDSGVANDVLSRWVDVLKKGAGTMVDEAAITSESEAIAEQFSQA